MTSERLACLSDDVPAAAENHGYARLKAWLPVALVLVSVPAGVNLPLNSPSVRSKSTILGQ